MEEQQLAVRYGEIRAILDNAGKQLESLGVRYLIGAVDRDPKAPDGGKVFMQSDAKGEDIKAILQVSLPTSQDVANLGIWVGQIMQDRRAQNGAKVTAVYPKGKKNGKR